jgi:hypothetical protein
VGSPGDSSLYLYRKKEFVHGEHRQTASLKLEGKYGREDSPLSTGDGIIVLIKVQ